MEKTLVQLPLFQEDSLANPSPLREREREQTMTATSGMRCYELFRVVNPPGLLAKMLKGLLTSKTAWSSDRCKMIWKDRASKSNVLLFQLVASVHGINETESGLLDAMYPTPAQYEDRTLPETIHKMTPERRQMKMSNLASRLRYQTMYPTPNTQDGLTSPSEDIENWEKRAEKKKKEQGINLHFALRHAVQKEEQRTAMYPRPGGKLNPNFVEFLMGYPMNYTQIEPTESNHSETQSCHKSQNKSSGVS